jgi:hypothetical protein
LVGGGGGGGESHVIFLSLLRRIQVRSPARAKRAGGGGARSSACDAKGRGGYHLFRRLTAWDIICLVESITVRSAS